MRSGCYQDWDGLSSFGNRFFISLTPLFVLGLAGILGLVRAHLGGAGTAIVCCDRHGNSGSLEFGLIFQWGTHLIPARGPISWREAAYNQYAVVPGEAIHVAEDYLTRRGQLMEQIEQEDVRQLMGEGQRGTR